MSLNDMTGKKKSGLLGNLFSKKEESVPDRGASFADINRAGANKIIAELNKANQWIPGFPLEDQASLKSKVQGYVGFLSNAKAETEFSLEPLDVEICEIAKRYIEGLKQLDKKTLALGDLAINRGFVCRSEFHASERKNIEDVLNRRIELLKNMVASLDSYTQLVGERLQIIRQETLLAQMEEKLNAQESKIKETIAAKPALYTSIKNVDISNLDASKSTLLPEAYELAVSMSEFARGKKSLDNEKIALSLTKAELEERENQISQNEVLYHKNIHELDDETRKRLEEQQRLILDELKTRIDNFVARDRAQRALASEFEIILKNDDLVDVFLKSAEEFDYYQAHKLPAEEGGQTVAVDREEQHINV